MRKISYRFVYNRKKSLNDRGTALVQVEAYLNKKESVFFHTCLFTARTMGCKKENHQRSS